MPLVSLIIVYCICNYRLSEEAKIKVTSAQTDVVYETSNVMVAGVHTDGTIIANGKGTAKITIKANNMTKTVLVTVKAAPSKIKFKKAKLVLKKGKKAMLKYTLSKGSIGEVTFKSSNNKIVTVSSTGKIIAKKKGTATITVKTYNGKTDKINIVVK